MRNSSELATLKLAIIGCGAAAEQVHLPVIVTSDTVEATALVDKDIARAHKLAKKFAIPHVTDNYTEIFGQVDAVIVALPHVLHSAVSIDFLRRGIHVLVEKPMALTTDECEAMISAANQSGAILAVGLVRRFLHAHQFAKKLISDGFLGTIKSFDVREGSIYSWPVASDFFFRKEAGGGVLADTGAHTLDTILWWLGDYDSFEYLDDNLGGVEADCEIRLRMKNGAKGVVELSRTRNLRNTAIICGEKATLEVQMRGPQISIQPNGANGKIIGNVTESENIELKKNQSVGELTRAQLEDWVAAIHDERKPYITGEEAARSVRLLEACYHNCKPLELPWLKRNKTQGRKGMRVLVTGGTGSIGGHLVERLVMDYNAEVRVLVRDFARTSRIARFPIQMVPGDVTDAIAVHKAMEGCDIVFHLAYGNRGSPSLRKRETVQGTKNVLEAALRHKLKRVVNVSTISVYGKTKDGDLDESAPRKYSNRVYANSKLKAEKLAFHYFRKYGLPVSIIQPTIVYGPFIKGWTIEVIERLKMGRVILPEEGKGLCNAVYVDDVVKAMLLAATRDEAVGEAFLISAKEPVTWRDFYSAYEQMLGVKSTILASQSDIADLKKRYKQEHATLHQIVTALRRRDVLMWLTQLPAVEKIYKLAEAIIPPSRWERLKYRVVLSENPIEQSQPGVFEGKPFKPLTDFQAWELRARTRVMIDKAKRLLGYEPSFDLEQGMKLTEMWVKYSNLV